MNKQVESEIRALQRDHGDFITDIETSSVINYVHHKLATESERAKISADENKTLLLDLISDALGFSFKIDAVEIASHLFLTDNSFPGNDVFGHKSVFNIEHVYGFRRSARNLSMLMTSVISAIERGKVSVYHKQLISQKIRAHRTYSFFTDFCVLEQDSEIQIVIPSNENLNVNYKALLDVEAKMLAYEIDSLQIDSDKEVVILQASLSEPMVDSLLKYLSLPSDFDAAEAMMTGRLISDNFKPVLNYSIPTQFTFDAINSIVDARALIRSGNSTHTASQKLKEIYSQSGTSHLALLESYQKAVKPIIQDIVDNIPYGFIEFCDLIQQTHNTLLEEVFDRNSIINDLVFKYEYSFIELAYLPVGTLILRLLRASTDEGVLISMKIHLKSVAINDFDDK